MLLNTIDCYLVIVIGICIDWIDIIINFIKFYYIIVNHFRALDTVT